MSTKLKAKRMAAVAFLATALFIIAGAIRYSYLLQNALVFNVSKRFYYLVSTSTHTQVSVYDAVQNGGAGYLLQSGDREYVALSVYLTEEEATLVQGQFIDDTCTLLQQRVDALYFKTQREKDAAPRVCSALKCLDGCIQVLNNEIARLEKGATQQSSKSTLKLLRQQFVCLMEEYENDFPKFSAVCAAATMQLDEFCSQVVYAQRLRYLLCELCVGYTRLCAQFSI